MEDLLYSLKYSSFSSPSGYGHLVEDIPCNESNNLVVSEIEDDTLAVVLFILRTIKSKLENHQRFDISPEHLLEQLQVLLESLKQSFKISSCMVIESHLSPRQGF